MGTYDTRGGHALHDPSADMDDTMPIEDAVLEILEAAGIATSVNDAVCEAIRTHTPTSGLDVVAALKPLADAMKQYEIKWKELKDDYIPCGVFNPMTLGNFRAIAALYDTLVMTKVT